jgi:hypothetical protein
MTRPFRSYLLYAAPLLITMGLYAYSVRLPFYLDDLPHLAIFRSLPPGAGKAIIAFWQGVKVYPYYRPVMFTFFALDQWLEGYFDPASLHLFTILSYGLTAVIMGLLVKRLAVRVVPKARAIVAGLVAGIGFALYPFSYQAVTLISAWAHIGLTLGVMLVLYFALLWLDGGGKGCLLLCWGSAAFGIFSHENSFLLLPLAGLLIVLLYGLRALWQVRTLWVLLPVALMTGVYVVVWFSIPRNTALTLFTPWLADSLATMAQGVIYPFVALLRPFVTGDASAVFLLLLAVVVVGIALGWLLWRARSAAALAAYGVLWYSAAVLPSALFLAPSYVSGSPRLTLFGAAGAAIFWGILAAALWACRPRLAARSVVILASALAVFVSLRFLQVRASDFARMSDYTWQLIALVREQSPKGLLLVNAPDYIAPLDSHRTFLRGAEGVAFIGPLVFYQDLFAANGGVADPPLNAISVNALNSLSSDLLYTDQPALDGAALTEAVRAASHIYVTDFEGDQFRPVYVGGTGLAGSNDPIVKFGQGEITLTQVQANFSPQRNIVTVLTRWRVESPQAVKPGVYVFCNGEFIAQRDGAVWGATYPFSAWRSGENETDLREIPLSHPVTANCLRVYTAIYPETDPARWQAVEVASGKSYADNLAPIPLTGTSDALFPFGSALNGNSADP